MNDYKRALNEVAGDMKESEQRLKNKLLHNKSPKRKKPFYLVPVGITALFMMLMASWFMIEVKVDTKQANSSIEENMILFDFYIAGEQLSFRESGFSSYIQALGVFELAKKYKLSYTDEEYKKQFDQYSQDQDPENIGHQLLEIANISQLQFEERLFPMLIELRIYRDKLKEVWYEKFPVMNDLIVEAYTTQQAELYMEQHFAKEIEQFQQEHQIVSMAYGTMPITGVVAAVNENVFYFIKNMTAQELATLSEEQIFNQPEDKLATWMMNGKEVPVQVGDYIKLKNYGTSAADDENELAISVNEDIEVLLPNERASEIQEVTFADDARQQMEDLLENAAWEDLNFTPIKIYDKPKYIVHVNDASYTIWENARKQFIVMPFGQPKVWIMYQKSSKQLKALIEENVTK
ncbi:hypothetical protein [Solibacillus sp. FSL K6-1523]|uniref:hypothetical protein n=1 Tax=Solibacillus sp. FSL K6-1523 TaxID=2921471 RepID=UPI0030F6E99A